MIESYYNVLNEDEITFLKNECDVFIAEQTPTEFSIKENKTNYYFRKFIPENKMFCFYDKILNNLHNKRNIKHHINGIWINKINSDSNKNDFSNSIMIKALRNTDERIKNNQ